MISRRSERGGVSVALALEVALAVDVAAEDASEAALAELVAWANQHSPIGDAVRRAIDVRLSVNGKPAAARYAELLGVAVSDLEFGTPNGFAVRPSRRARTAVAA